MQVPIIKLSHSSQNAAKQIIKASKKKLSLSQQNEMANYYAFLYKNPSKDNLNYAKLLLSK